MFTRCIGLRHSVTSSPAFPPEPGLLGIIGKPVRSSLSPAMHQAALRRLGLDARYQAFEISPAQVPDVLRALSPLGFWGINVTIPYKELVLPFLDEVDPEAAAIGAVNTVVVRGGRLVGHNTDAEGFRLALEVEGRTALRGARVLVVGAGGAARAVAYACLARGCDSLLLANRSAPRARSLGRAMKTRFPAADIAATATAGRAWASRVAASSVVVNTTPLGGRPGDPLPIPPEALRRGQTVMDIVYRPRRTPLLAAAAAAGARTVDGLQMLLHQGALAFALWTGREAPLAAMRRALSAAAGATERRR
jgi:shikimate dehydrogenase